MKKLHLLKTILLLCALIVGSGTMWGQTYNWVATAIGDLKTNDIVVIVDKNTSKAMTNNNGTSSAPTASSVTLNNGKTEITSNVGSTIQWVVTASNGSYSFGVSGTTNKLYCTNTNNGVRVGTNSNNAFSWTSNFLKNTATSRYVGVYNEQDWRCYTTIHDNIKATTTTFYKRVEVQTTHTLTYSATNGSISGVVYNTSTAVASGASVAEGGKVTLTATPSDGYTFSSWEVSGTGATLTSTSTNPTTFTMGTANATVTANFVASSTVATPSFTISEGTYNAAQSVEINCGTDDATIYYTTDGTDPNTSSSVYSSAISVTQTTTIKAIAVKGGLDNSEIASATYTLKCVAPSFDPAAGSVGYGTVIALSTTTDGATIYYTTNGDTPTSSSSAYDSSNKPTVSGNQTFKAIATKSGWSDSDVSSAAYTYYYVITSASNNDSYGTVSGTTTITATPAEGYRVMAGDDGYTVTSGMATVTNNGDNTFTVEASSNCTVQINFEAIPTHIVTFSINGDVSRTAEVAEGSKITFPTAKATPADATEFPKTFNGKTFVGWYTAAYSHASTAPSYVNTATATMSTSDVTYYAVYATVTPGSQTTVTDALTTSTFGSPSSYTSWTNKTKTSSAVYAGQSSGGTKYIQIRSTSPSGIVSTTSGGKVTKVTVTWDDGTADDRTLDVYGKTSAYTGSTDLYSNDDSTVGTKLGSLYHGVTINSVKTTTTELTIGGNYQFIGLRSSSGAMYLGEIDIQWTTGTPDTYSNFTTDARTDAGIAYANDEVDAKLTSGYTGQALTNPNSVTVTYSSSDATVATVNNSTGAITELLKAGSTTITASFAGNATYKPAEVSYTLNVTEKTPAGLAYAVDAVEKVTTDDAFTNTLTNAHSLSVSYSSSATSVATVNSSTGEVTIKGAGSTTITATFAGDGDYEAGDASYTLTVSKATPTLSFASANITGHIGEAVSANALTNPANLTVSYSSSDETVATVNTTSGVVANPLKAGTTTITATFTGNDTYVAGNASYTLKVLANPTISVSDDDVDFGKTYTFDASGLSSYGDVTLTSGNTSIATVAGLVITPVAVGTVTITVSTAENEDYRDGQGTFDLTINAPAGATTSDELITTLDFTDNSGWELPTSETSTTTSYDNGDYEITLAGAHYFQSTSKYLMLKGSTGVLTFPEFDKKVTRIDVVGKTGASGNTKENIYVGSKAVSTETTGSTGTNTFSINSDYQDVGTIYSLKVTDKNAQITSIEVYTTPAAATVTLNKYGYATYCSTKPMDFSTTSGYTAWRISAIDGNTITFKKINEAIKGGQGVLLYNKNADGVNTSNINVNFANSSKVYSDSENLLVGTTAPTYVAANEYYGLSGDKFVPVTPAGVVPAGKALLPADALSSAREFNFVFLDEETTGIRNLIPALSEGEGAVYDLQGRKVAEPKKGGLYIVNGRKVVIK